MTYFWTLVRFQFRILKSTWHRVPVLLGFIFLQLGFLLINSSAEREFWFIPVSVVLFTLILNQSFDQTIQDDLADDGLAWLISEQISMAVYFLAKCFAFCVAVMCPGIFLILLIWLLKGDQFVHFGVMGAALFLVGVQNIGLAGAISAATYASKKQAIHISLAICLIPLGLSSLIFLCALEQMQVSSFSALSILGGLALVSIALGMILFSYSICCINRNWQSYLG
jgi:ABC-type transport system involved in cytochrome c biogenesis permease component